MTADEGRDVSAHEALALALVTLVDRQQRPPCAADPERWTSPNPLTRADAAEECRPCPILAPCAAAGDLEGHHVWGGRDRTPTTTRKVTT